ncbi:FixH family protein [Leptospira noguchii]|uniref:FixH family protein n=1 Tax=Leptospira noguchii TaxID=28182 RepID=UPI00058704A2|nr:FixH family protein [Leptospira noguchii]
MALHKSMKLAFFWIWIAFIALIGATIVTIRYANSGDTGLIEKEYYEKGLNYEKSILEQKKMIEEGYSYESILFTQNPNLKTGRNSIEVRFLKSKVPITGAKLKIEIERPATDLWNRNLILKEDPKTSGTYFGVLEFSGTGKWALNIKGEISGKTLKKTIYLNIQ